MAENFPKLAKKNKMDIKVQTLKRQRGEKE